MSRETSTSDQSCRCCGCGFSCEQLDFAFYQKFMVPPPTLCPECRQIRRMAQVNQLHLFKRRCDATGEMIVSSYPEDAPFRVFQQEYWYSDSVDNTEFGREIDFTRPFFEQYRELQLTVPRPALFTDYLRDENSAYTNFAGRNKNCYLIFDSDENRDCYYSYSINGSKSCVDCYRVEHSELCYEVVDSRKCYGSSYLVNCEGCSESILLDSCIGCDSCIMCTNLRHKQYYVRNKRVSKSEYEQLRESLTSFATLAAFIAEFTQFVREHPRRALRGFQNENSYGNYLTNCRNAWNCFDCRDVWDARYCYQSFMKLKDCMDTDQCGEGELLYECSNLGYNAYNVRFSQMCLNQLSELTYCELCFNGCSNLFGCIGLKRKQFCILNKQYTQAEYVRVSGQLIAHMVRTGEWGESFPSEIASAPYNLSVAQQFKPLTKEKALAAGYSWRDEAIELKGSSIRLPDLLSETDSEITTQTMCCSECRRGYRIITAELDFYRQLGLPAPRLCFLCRHQQRMKTRAPREMLKRSCSCCNNLVDTVYQLDEANTIYCETCYLEALD